MEKNHKKNKSRKKFQPKFAWWQSLSFQPSFPRPSREDTRQPLTSWPFPSRSLGNQQDHAADSHTKDSGCGLAGREEGTAGRWKDVWGNEVSGGASQCAPPPSVARRFIIEQLLSVPMSGESTLALKMWINKQNSTREYPWRPQLDARMEWKKAA